MLVGQFSPGPDFLLVLKNALNHGRRTALLSVAGITVGLTVHTSLALAGLAFLFAAESATGAILRYAGAAYLVYVAITLWRTLSGAGDGRGGKSPRLGDRAAFTQGLLTNLLNPKVVIFLSAMLAQFLAPDSPPADRWIYGAIIVGQGAAFWALFAHILQIPPVRRSFLRYQRPANMVFAGLLVIVAIRTCIA